MKRVPMTIEEMDGAREAMNSALQRAVMIMEQKNVSEATATIAVRIAMDPMGGRPEFTYKTTVRVPVEISDKGTAVKASQIEWDEDLRAFVLLMDGEQIKIAEAG